MNSIYKLAKSVLFRFTPEQAHHIILSHLDWATQLGAQKLVTRSFPENPIEIMGLRFPNCVGLAAGMDKDGEHVTAFGALGFGSVEIGTVTPKGQPGNPKPRLFRLIPDEAIINRMGFNNVGAIQVAKNLQSARAFRNRGGILGINIGKNKVTPNSEALSDYKKCMVASTHPVITSRSTFLLRILLTFATCRLMQNSISSFLVSLNIVSA